MVSPDPQAIVQTFPMDAPAKAEQQRASEGVPATLVGCAPDQAQSSGAIYRICLPAEWNGDLVVYAHGYVSPFRPVEIPEEQVGPLPDIFNGLGFAFATTSYAANGLAVKEGIPDLLELVEIFRRDYGDPGAIYLVSFSLGALISTLATEQTPDWVTASLPSCGPIGSFRAQIDSIGDFRVIFDYFFPGLIPGSPVAIPQAVIDEWESVYEPRIQAALTANPAAAQQVIAVTGAATNPEDPSSLESTFLEVLWYNVFSTNDAAARLGGQPYDNQERVYRGSNQDFLLNQRVPRFAAEASALTEIATHYETSGGLRIPTQTMHTLRDPLVPYWHEPLYRLKVLQNREGRHHRHIPIDRYGHCAFSPGQLLADFALMVRQVTGSGLVDPTRVLTDPQDQVDFQAVMALE
ncbi:MAG: hypothetical protein NW237_03175 [Cyanobacteriota bacterium]|nr:hypothetical protein [Cyanobacteriota bacterium]